jgi:hypothetical protein
VELGNLPRNLNENVRDGWSKSGLRLEWIVHEQCKSNTTVAKQFDWVAIMRGNCDRNVFRVGVSSLWRWASIFRTVTLVLLNWRSDLAPVICVESENWMSIAIDGTRFRSTWSYLWDRCTAYYECRTICTVSSTSGGVKDFTRGQPGFTTLV